MIVNSDTILEQGTEIAEAKFVDFVEQLDAVPSLLATFGIDNNWLLNKSQAIENISDFSLPNLEIRSGKEIDDAFGAYSFETNTIYISQEFLANSAHDLDAVAEVVLEEWGHYLDNQINLTDTPGDEGAIFASLVMGEDLSNEELASLQAEDDRVTVEIDGELITIEQQDNDLGVDVPNLPGRVIYVNQNATGNNDGSSWANAYTDLQPALEVAGATNEVWVAQGTYLPTTDGGREQSFVLGDGAKVYGGFAGTETERGQRDVLNNRVTLSGHIGAPGDRSDNSYNVVTIEDNPFPTVLDGFTIVGGQADDIANSRGAGIYVEDNADVVNLSNLIVANNRTTFVGGGIYQSDSVTNFSNVAFLNNSVESSGGFFGEGGALYSERSVANITNSLFVNNKAVDGGAIAVDNASFAELDAKLNIANSTFVGNQADEGGVVYDSSFDDPPVVRIANSIFELNPTVNGNLFEIDRERIAINNSLVQGGFDGTGENIIDADPQFIDFNNNNYALQESSPGVDAGNNAVIEGVERDLVGNARITNGTVDIGAYETVLAPADIPDGSPVYRFFIPDSGAHFYTADEAEKNNILETQPNYDLEGTPYNSAPAVDSLTGVAPVYRFLNNDTGIRIYTIDEAERESITNLPNYQPEGIAYYGYTEQIENTTPLYRFYNPVIDAHFYTSSTVERDSVLENLPNYQLESNGGVAYYVEPLDALAPIAPPPVNSGNNSSATLGDVLRSLLN